MVFACREARWRKHGWNVRLPETRSSAHPGSHHALFQPPPTAVAYKHCRCTQDSGKGRCNHVPPAPPPPPGTETTAVAPHTVRTRTPHLLVEDGLGLATITLLLSVVTTLACEQRGAHGVGTRGGRPRVSTAMGGGGGSRKPPTNLAQATPQAAAVLTPTNSQPRGAPQLLCKHTCSMQSTYPARTRWPCQPCTASPCAACACGTWRSCSTCSAPWGCSPAGVGAPHVPPNTSKSRR